MVQCFIFAFDFALKKILMEEINMKRLIALILAVVLPITVAFGCKQTDNEQSGTEQPQNTQSGADATKKPSVICTIFPQYDWVRQILGENSDNFDLTLLLDNRIDLHNYQPSMGDMVKISECDLFIHVGGESDGWVDAVLRQSSNPNMVVINLLDILGDDVKQEEIIEGMEYDDDDDFDDNHGDDSEDEDDCEYDEHVWLSLINAQTFCAVIADALTALDADNATLYYDNLIMYIQELSRLDSDYRAVVNEANVRTLLFGDRFPFRYLVDDYGIDYFAAFPGCSAETEASFETILFLSDKIDELGLGSIMVTESADQSIARTIVNNTSAKNQQIHVLNAMQSITASDVRDGTSFISIMRSNLDVLKGVLT